MATIPLITQPVSADKVQPALNALIDQINGFLLGMNPENVDIVGGTIANVTINNSPIGNITPSTGAFIALTATSGAINGDGIVTLTATQTLTNKALTAPVISGGTINNAIIGGVTPAAATFTTATATSFVGPLTGNASSATKLAVARNINGVAFDGTADITVTAAAGTLTGTTLNSTVVASSLTSLGTLTSLTVSGATSLGAALNMNSHQINNLTDPTNAQDAATKMYVDSVAQGLSVKASAIVATAAALPTNVYNNGTSGVGATLTGVSVGVLTIDGIAIAAGNRIIVKNEAAPANNGIYSCTIAGAVATAYVLTRTTDANTSAELDGAFVFIDSGTVNKATGWVIANSGAIIIGTTAINWTQFSGAGTYLAGTGLTLAGNTFSLTSPVTPALGGTGVNNGTSTLTYAGNVTFSGAFTFAALLTANTSITVPIAGTLATLAGTETLTNKTVNGVVLTATGSASNFLTQAGTYVSAAPPLAATNAQELAGTSNAVFTSPLTQQAHLSGCKAWVVWNASGTILDSYNISSVTSSGGGAYTVNFTSGPSTNNYSAAMLGSDGGSANGTLGFVEGTRSTSSCSLLFINPSNLGGSNSAYQSMIFFWRS